MDSGRLIQKSNASDVIFDYYAGNKGISPSHFDGFKNGKPTGDDYVALVSAEISDESGQACAEYFINENINFSLTYRIINKINKTIVPIFEFYTADGTYAFGATSHKPLNLLPPGDYIFHCKIPPNFLNAGTYFVGICLHSFDGETINHVIERNALMFNIKDLISLRGYGYTGPIAGAVRPKFNTSIEKL